MSPRIVRLIVLGGVLVALVLVAHFSGVTASFSTDKVRTLIQSAGAWGVLLFIVGFAVGELLHVPGLVFLGAAVLAWGRVRGGILGFGGALLSVSFSFWFVRAVGGQPLADVRNRRLKAILARLETHPVLVIALLRLLTWMAPAMNYVLALSSVRYVDYLVGSALGLAIPVAVFSGLFGIFFR